MDHRSWIAPALLLSLGLSACGSGGDTLAPPPSLAPQPTDLPFASLGELEDAIRVATASSDEAERLDTDGDSLPDGIESRLGTSPLLTDTDHDGLVDGFELFGTDFDRAAPLPDRDHDGLVSPRDPDDDGDGSNDGLVVDTDGDLVANYLELYGYTYDILTGEFELWNGDPDVPHYFTDPLQPSTDQDAYPDGMEVSGALLDPTVEHPGDDPLVPAYPNIACELMGYTATLNADIQITETESLSEGRTWSRQTDRTSSRSVQNQWEIGGEASYGTDSGVKVSAKFGQTYDNTNSTTNSVGSGESITSEEGWSKAQSSNPTSAAHMKLFLRVRNRGTAPLSNFKPTLTLKVGGLNVATFEPSGAEVSLLVPGATYPPEVGSYWVVDGKDTGGGAEPISLTITELRALERGAPVSIVVTQVDGETMQLTKGGAWESMGDANEFTARCDAVCANVRIELENGDLIHHLVYADEGPSAPPMSLGTALQKLGVDEDGTLVYFDENGTPHERSLEEFHFAFDPATLRANGWILAADDPSGTTETTAPAGFQLEAMRLLPDSIVYVRAPRDPATPAEPTVHFATLDPDTGEIQVSAADYAGIRSVVVHDEDRSNSQELVEYVPGAGLYSGSARGPGGFSSEVRLAVEVENLDGLVVTREIGSLYTAPGPQPPVIHGAELDLQSHRVYANVETGNPKNSNSAIVLIRSYHPDFSGGFAELERVYDYYRDPLGFEADLPPNFGQGHPNEDIEIVAYVRQGIQAVSALPLEGADPVGVRQNRVDTVQAVADGQSNWLGNLVRIDWRVDQWNLDTTGAPLSVLYPSSNAPFYPPAIPGAPIDLTLRMDGLGVISWARFYWNARYKKADVGGLDTYRFMTRDDIEAADAEIIEHDDQKVGRTNDNGADIRPGDVLMIRTVSGRPAKLFLESVSYDHNVLQDKYWVNVTIRYVVFESSN